MQERLEIPSLKYFFSMLGLMVLYTLPLYLLEKVFPGLKGSEAGELAAVLVMAGAVYPAARSAGFSFGRLAEYLAGYRSEFRAAFLWFVAMKLLLPAGDYLYSAFLAALDLPIANTLLFWNSQANNPAAGAGRLDALLAGPLWIAAYLFTGCVAAPLLEEFIFRRWLYAAMRRGLKVWPSVLLNSALFGALHGKDFAGTAACSVFFCLAYERSGRLQTPVLVHGLSNLLSFLFLFAGRLL